MNSRIFAITSVLAWAASASAGIDLTPGTLLATRFNDNVIRQIDPTTGSVLSQISVPLPQTPIGGGFDSVAVNDGRLYGLAPFNQFGSWVYEINPQTGATTQVCFINARSIGHRGANMLAETATYSWDGTQIQGFVPYSLNEGGPWSFFQETGWREGEFWMMMDNGGNLTSAEFRRFGPDGSFSIATFLPKPANRQGVCFDVNQADGEMFWVTRTAQPLNGSGQAYLHRSFGATSFAEVPLAINNITDIAYIPIPAPGAAGIVGLAVIVAARRRRAVV